MSTVKAKWCNKNSMILRTQCIMKCGQCLRDRKSSTRFRLVELIKSTLKYQNCNENMLHLIGVLQTKPIRTILPETIKKPSSPKLMHTIYAIVQTMRNHNRQIWW